MKVPLLDLKLQYQTVKDNTQVAINELLESQYFIGGPILDEFEGNVAKFLDVEYAIGVSSGTDALIASLMGIGLGMNNPVECKAVDEVILPSYTFFATAGSVWRLGAKPVFVDIDLDTYTIDVSKIEEKITPQTKAIIPVHLYGQCANMNEIVALAKKYNLKVIEDAAQAIGAKQNGLNVGTYGDCAALSFFPSKNLGGLGDGGMVVTNDKDLAVRIRELRNHGMSPKYYHKCVGGNFRLDAIQAAGLNVKLPYLSSWAQARKENALFYNEAFNANKNIKLPVIADENLSVYNQYIVSVPNRDEAINYLRESDIGCEIYYPVPLHMQECFKALGYKEGDLPNSEYAAKHTLALPIYPELTKEQLSYVAQKLMSIVK